MTCVLLNHNFINEVQTVTQLFFPGDGFRFVNEPLQAPGYIIQTEVANGVAIATVFKDGNVVAHKTIVIDSLQLKLSPRRVLMLVLYHALQECIGAYTPWGALTGIRPSKMVREWLQSGYSDQQVIATMQDPFCCTQEKAQLALAVAKAENSITRQIYKKPNPVGIYISVPFCPTRCVYCSFNISQKLASDDFQAWYVAAMVKEIAVKAAHIKQLGATVSSIYIGGGTPTVLSETLLTKLLDVVGENFGNDCEYSVEAGRPDTLTPSKLKIMYNHGVNRIAVNPQTLNDNTLKLIGRNHSAADFFAAFENARAAGFTCINTDIIAGLPGETTGDMHHTMEGLAKFNPENITVHTLAVKRASNLRGNTANYTIPSVQATEDMLRIANQVCARQGFLPYYLYRQKNMVGMFENVGYSKPGFECEYNVGMMAETQTVLGIGAGAVSKFVEGDKIWREFNTKDPEIYIERSN